MASKLLGRKGRETRTKDRARRHREGWTMKTIMNVNARVFSIALALATVAYGQRLALHYNQPAEDRQNQALPIGNGRLGAMIFGGAVHEHLQLNDTSLRTGCGKATGSYQNPRAP